MLKLNPPSNGYNVLFLFSFALFLVATINILLTLVTFKAIHKPLLITLLLSTTLISYFMQTYGVLIDNTMIQNAMQTDANEVLELIDHNIALHFLFAGVVPAFLIGFIKVEYSTIKRSVLRAMIAAALSLITIVISLSTFYKTYSLTFREHREIRYLIAPTNYLYYSVRYLSGAYDQTSIPFTALGEDAALKTTWMARSKKTVSVIIIGETARAANFSLNGYARETNPLLAQQEIINFTNAVSCGTTTAVSVPCMFSDKTKEDYRPQDATSRGNLLDVLNTAGFELLWRDNNSGCKGVCDRIPAQNQKDFNQNTACNETGCFDIAMLDSLDEFIEKSADKVVLVLHQLGSHGPAYSKRYPKRFETFAPVCNKTNLSDCPRQELINAYDNSILYTDFFISTVIDYFKQRQHQIDASVLYVSDHGESLGENNIYLHGLPYFLAPSEQTHIPMLLWMSRGFSKSFDIDRECLNKRAQTPVSHDNLFHSMLGLLEVNTNAYRATLDIFANCRTQRNHD